MNVLLTSIGRRSYLARYFQEALNGSGMVVGTNSIAMTPGMAAVDHAEVVSPSHHEGYVDEIINICERFDIRLLCSLHDLDVLILSRHRTLLESTGVIPVLPNAEWARICLDKLECGIKLKDAGFETPWTSVSLPETLDALATGTIKFPLIIKARHGFGSLGVTQCNDESELRLAYPQASAALIKSALDSFIPQIGDDGILIQEFLRGAELCVDVLNNLEGEFVASFVTQVHSMRAGESDYATTLSPTTTGDLAERLGALIRHRGILGVDLIADGERKVIVDVNPRFTGDYPFSHLAGANVPAALLAWARGNPTDPSHLKPKIGMTGFKDLVPTLSDRPCPREFQQAPRSPR